MTDIRGQALCIINPVAGRKGRGEKVWHSLQSIVSEYYAVSVHYTKPCHTATACIKENMNGKDIIICIGGDGTLNEVVATIVENGLSIPLLYVPAGTTNDFARTIRASSDTGTIEELLNKGMIVPHDVGFFNDKLIFVYVAAFGTLTRAASGTSQKMKNRLGYLAYLWSGFKYLLKTKPVQATITTDTDIITGKFLFGFISNSTSVGGMIRLKDNKVALNDGSFEILLCRYPNSILSFLITSAKLLWGRFDGKQLLLTHTSYVNVRCDDEIQWTIDGEPIKSATNNIDIKICQNAYKLYISRQVCNGKLYMGG